MLLMKEMKNGNTTHPVTQLAVSLVWKTTDQKQTVCFPGAFMRRGDFLIVILSI